LKKERADFLKKKRCRKEIFAGFKKNTRNDDDENKPSVGAFGPSFGKARGYACGRPPLAGGFASPAHQFRRRVQERYSFAVLSPVLSTGEITFFPFRKKSFFCPRTTTTFYAVFFVGGKENPQKRNR